MSLYLRPGSKVWWMDIYRGPGRKRIRRSTGKTNKAEAEVVERSFSAVNKGLGTRERLLQIVELMYEGSSSGLELEAVAAFYETAAHDDGVKIAPKTMTTRLNRVRRFAEWAKVNTRCHVVEDVTTPVAWAFSQWLVKPVKGESTMTSKSRNDYIADMGAVWKMLVKRGRGKDNPWTLARVQRDKNQEQTGRAFTREEEQRILDTAATIGHDWHGACVIARWTGLRMKDVVQMKWNRIDLDQGWIYATPFKTARHGIGVTTPIHPMLRAVLEKLPSRNAGPDQYVLPERQRADGKKYFRGDVPFSEILKRAGVKDDDPHVKLSFHCWRHTFDTRLAEAGVDQEVRMELTGHTVKETERIYNHDRSRLVDAVAKMK